MVSVSHKSCCSHWVLARARLMPNFATLPLIVECVSSIEITFCPSEANCLLVSMAWVAREQVFPPAKLFIFQSCLAAVPLSTSFASEDQGLVMRTDSLQPISHLFATHIARFSEEHMLSLSHPTNLLAGVASHLALLLSQARQTAGRTAYPPHKKPPVSQGFWRIG